MALEIPKAVLGWAPVPLRLGLGGGLVIHGGIKLFLPSGHENIVHLIAQLAVPYPDFMGWVVGIVEFGGGLGLLLGVLFRLAALLNVLNVLGLIILGVMAGGIPDPLPGGDPLPQFREASLILCAALSLLLSGPGRHFVLGSRLRPVSQRAH